MKPVTCGEASWVAGARAREEEALFTVNPFVCFVPFKNSNSKFILEAKSTYVSDLQFAHSKFLMIIEYTELLFLL